MNHINTQLAARRTSLARAASTSSIEVSVSNTNNTSIELPGEIDSLNVGSDFWRQAKGNRYRMLIREGHLSKLLKLAETARSKNKPAFWFARACSVKYWESRTLPYLAKLADVQELAALVALKLRIEVTKFIYQQIWRGANVERWADTAQEMPHAKAGQSRIKHFAWLCRREIDARTVALV